MSCFLHKKLSTKKSFKISSKKFFTANFAKPLDKISGGGIIELSLIERKSYPQNFSTRGGEK